MRLNEFLKQQLTEADAQQARRHRRLIASAQGATLLLDNRIVHNFCSNDYLGIANHPDIKKALIAAAEKWGVGSGASHLVTGHTREHDALEQELAAFTARESALLFSTGWMANTGAISALMKKGDLVLEDKLNHASLIDGGLQSNADFKRYLHHDLHSLKKNLAASTAQKKLVVTDSVFSMDGDIAPLNDISALCAQYDAWLMVDDAHGFGVLGQRGEGAVAAAKLNADHVPILMCTLGKAIGTAGAFIAGSKELIDYLVQSARPFIYSTAMPAAVAAATRQALLVVQKENWRRTHLHNLIALFRATAQRYQLPLMASPTAIQPIVLGSNARALQASEALSQRGFLVSAIRPPTVPKGSARLRVTLSAAHDENTVLNLVEALADIVVHLPPDHE
jgi:8-amino-7-oxononanoate synthase